MIITTDRTVSDCLSVVSIHFIIGLWKNIRVHQINTGMLTSALISFLTAVAVPEVTLRLLQSALWPASIVAC